MKKGAGNRLCSRRVECYDQLHTFLSGLEFIVLHLRNRFILVFKFSDWRFENKRGWEQVVKMLEIHSVLVSMQIVINYISEGERVRHVKLFYSFLLHQRKRKPVARLSFICWPCCQKFSSWVLWINREFSWVSVLRTKTIFLFFLGNLDIEGRLPIHFLWKLESHVRRAVTFVYLSNLSINRKRRRKSIGIFSVTNRIT